MSYTTRVQGSFSLIPHLSWEEIKASPFTNKGHRLGMTPAWSAPGIDLLLLLSEEEPDVGGGLLLQRTATHLIMPDLDEYRAHDLVEQVQKIIDLFPGRDFEGRLECTGEEAGDLWRVEVSDRKAEKLTPRIVWPHQDIATWGSAMEADRLEPEDHTITLSADGQPQVRIHLSFSQDLQSEERMAFFGRVARLVSDAESTAGATRDAMGRLADEISALPLDHELDPGRREAVSMLRQRAAGER